MKVQKYEAIKLVYGWLCSSKSKILFSRETLELEKNLSLNNKYIVYNKSLKSDVHRVMFRSTCCRHIYESDVSHEAELDVHGLKAV